MTSQILVVTTSGDMILKAFIENREFLQYSRIQIFKNNTDNITGYVFRQFVFEKTGRRSV